MKKISVFFGINLCLIAFFISVSAQKFKTVRDGIEYAEMTRQIADMTMFLDGKVVNHPSDQTGERKVGDAILVTPR